MHSAAATPRASKSLLKKAMLSLTPPILLQLIDRWVLQRAIRLEGEYPNWSAAAAVCDGYADSRVLEQVTAAALSVRDGTAAYDQDGVVFQAISPDWPLVAVLSAAALLRSGDLRVLDFGGALGNAYRRNRTFLPAVTALTWAVVEQPQLVRTGTQHFQSDELRFYDSIQEAAAGCNPRVLLLGSVLQYLPNPQAVFDELLSAADWDAVVVQRTPMWQRPDTVTVQVTPRWIYGTPICYPSWVFNEDSLPTAAATRGLPAWAPVVDQSLSLHGDMVEYRTFAAGRAVRVATAS
jgi:putative methyltransferase (TIGR04325 family)